MLYEVITLEHVGRLDAELETLDVLGTGQLVLVAVLPGGKETDGIVSRAVLERNNFV